jgi:Ser/Thr protein kinase RdoA (MazF antagonist)
LSRDAQLIVPRPVKSKRRQLLETVSLVSVGAARHCSLLEWIEGRFIGEHIRPAHMQSLGRFIGRLHHHAQHRTVIERRYWDAEGLVGRKPKFGPIERLPGISPSAQRIVSEARHATLRQLQRLESSFPDKQGLIHADLHFGNVLLSGGRIAAIDFDDCGFGFLAYDLAVPLLSVRKESRKEFLALKTALIDGYAREWKWDDDDEEILASLMTARRLAMLGWLNSRSDNPKLRAHLKTATADVVKYLRKN